MGRVNRFPNVFHRKKKKKNEIKFELAARHRTYFFFVLIRK